MYGDDDVHKAVTMGIEVWRLARNPGYDALGTWSYHQRTFLRLSVIRSNWLTSIPQPLHIHHAARSPHDKLTS